MAGPLNAKVIIARCSKTNRAFGIRIEQQGRDWVRTWAFKLDERKAEHEGYKADSKVSGSMNTTDEYPGCPWCGDYGFVRCACGKIGCSGGIVNSGACEEYTCPWCKEHVILENADNFEVSGGGY